MEAAAPALVLLAAGLGQRYGGLKQLAPVGPAGETLLDYTLFDAWRAGFGRAVCIVRPEVEAALQAAFAQRSPALPVSYVHQQLTDLPHERRPPAGRTRPWGTGHAVLAAAEAIDGPFAVANADDFYGAEALAALAVFLRDGSPQATDGAVHALVAYRLRDTLPETGAVARGVCAVTPDGWLAGVHEVTRIERDGADAHYVAEDGAQHTLPGDTLVSMNLWGFQPGFMTDLAAAFGMFLDEAGATLEREFYLPAAVDAVLRRNAARVRVLRATGAWCGLTHRADHAAVAAHLARLTATGAYPATLQTRPRGDVRHAAAPDERHAQLESTVGCFAVPGNLVAVQPLAGGHIHDSYVVTLEQNGRPTRYVLQRLNRRIFPAPAPLMENIRRVTRHVRDKLVAGGQRDVARRVLTLVTARDGAAWLRDGAGNAWRMFVFIPQTRSDESVTTAAQAELAGRAYGHFQSLLADLPEPRLHETLPGFHDTPTRYAAFDAAVAADAVGRVAAAAPEIAFVQERRALGGVLMDLLRQRDVPERVAHNDAKLSNVLLDATTGAPLCVVDLDTVMPGTALFDFGDMVRSMTCWAAEDECDLTRVAVRRDLFAGLAHGYLQATADFLTPAEREHLVQAGLVITLEQALRFLTDYLAGDVYYKTTRPHQNLDRCRVQLRLVASLEAQRGDLESLLATPR